MRPQHIATIGVAGVFAAAATSAISLAEYRLIHAGRDALAAFFMPGGDGLSIVDGTRSSYVASDFERSAEGSYDKRLVTKLKSEITQVCPDKSPEIHITALKQPAAAPRAARVASSAVEVRVKKASLAPPAPSSPAPRRLERGDSVTLVSGAPVPLTEPEGAVVFHGGHPDEVKAIVANLPGEAVIRAATRMRTLEATLTHRALAEHMKSRGTVREFSWTRVSREEPSHPGIKVYVEVPAPAANVKDLPSMSRDFEAFIDEKMAREFEFVQREAGRDFTFGPVSSDQ